MIYCLHKQYIAHQNIERKTTINIKLKEKRKDLNLTQTEVALKSKISIRYYQYLENGDCTPNVEIAQRIARVLNTSVEELFCTQKEVSQNEQKSG